MNIKVTQKQIDKTKYLAIVNDKRFYIDYFVPITENSQVYHSFLNCLIGVQCAGITDVNFEIDKLSENTVKIITEMQRKYHKIAQFIYEKKFEKPSFSVQYNKELSIDSSANLSDKVIHSMSGGKDSLLSFGIFSKLLKVETVPVTVKMETIAHNVGLKKYIDEKFSSVGIQTNLVKTNYNKISTFTDQAFAEAKLNCDDEYIMSHCSKKKFLRHNMYHFTQSIAMLSVAESFGARWIANGDDGRPYTCIIVDDEEIPFVEYGVTQYWKDTVFELSDKRIKPFSIIHALNNESSVLKILVKEFPEYAKIFTSCLTSVNRWCHNCAKCFIVFNSLIAINENPFDYGFEYSKVQNLLSNLQHFLAEDKFGSYIRKDDCTPRLQQEKMGYNSFGLKYIPETFRAKVESIFAKHLRRLDDQNSEKEILAEVKL